MRRISDRRSSWCFQRGCAPSTRERLAAGYADPKPTALVVTKLDETNEIGGVLHASLPGSTPVAYLCNGPRVPEDIKDAAVGTVVDAVLPREE